MIETYIPFCKQCIHEVFRMIGTRVDVEYEENVDGVVKNLGWIKGTVMDYDKVMGYLVQFPDDVDWIQTLNSKDVRIIK